MSVLTLVEYMKEQKRKDCPVCQLADEVRAQLDVAREKGIRRKDQLLWLRDAVGVEITDSQMTSHVSGRHDE